MTTAAILTWLSAHWFELVLAIVGGGFVYNNRDKIFNRDKDKPAPEGELVAGDANSIDGLLSRLVARVTPLLDKLDLHADAGKRAVHLAMLVFIEDDVAELEDGPEKQEQLAAIQTLAKYRVVSSPEPVVVKRAK